MEYYAGSLGNNLSQTFTTLDCGLELSHSGLELLLRGPADMDGSKRTVLLLLLLLLLLTLLFEPHNVPCCRVSIADSCFSLKFVSIV